MTKSLFANILYAFCVISLISIFSERLQDILFIISALLISALLIIAVKFKPEQRIEIFENYMTISNVKGELGYSIITLIYFNPATFIMEIRTESGDIHFLDSNCRKDFLSFVHAGRKANPAIYVEETFPLDAELYQELVAEFEELNHATPQTKREYYRKLINEYAEEEMVNPKKHFISFKEVFGAIFIVGFVLLALSLRFTF